MRVSRPRRFAGLPRGAIVTEQGPKLTTAVTLMRMALALVDEAGEDGVAVRLQEAIDVATNVPVPRTIE